VKGYVHNSAQTLRVYHPGKAIGEINPTLPDPPPPPAPDDGGGGGGFGAVLVAVVATIFTAGVAAVALAPGVTLSSAGLSRVMSSGLAVLGGQTASVGAVGGGVLAVRGAAGGLAAAAVGGAVGSIVGQGVAIATGLQDAFSWGAAGAGALGALAMSGVCRMAAQDHADVAREIEPALWDANEQGRYEDGLELLLMACLLDEAAEMIRSARSMRGKGVKERFTGSKAIVKAGTCPITDPKVRDAYMAMFDAVRDPQFDTRGGCPLTVVEKFSLGVLWDKYFVSTDGTIDWDRALEATRA
jgi:hypothetical protein